ncbi:MAG: hypothetical protein Q7S40_03555 [Opitutaceae bacterium]|nr:hypothetical protein [Opitutaceae bacterium]
MNTTQEPHSTSRYKDAYRIQKFVQLRDDHWLRQETIAGHYVSLFNTAKDMLEIVEARRHTPPDKRQELDAMLVYLERTITDAHWHAFGIPLEWPGAVSQ